MSKDFILPDIGEGIVECEIVEWLVAEGDEVKEDQPVVEVMTDKAMVEIPAKDDGVVEKLYYQKGDIAKVHEPLFRINADGDAGESAEDKTAEKERQNLTVSQRVIKRRAVEPLTLFYRISVKVLLNVKSLSGWFLKATK